MRLASFLWFLAAAISLGGPGVHARGLLSPIDTPQLSTPAAVPGAPALSHTVVGTTVTLMWVPAPVGGTPASYVLEASLSAGGAAIAVFPVAQTSLTVPNVPPGTYFVRVRAVNAEGSGPPSNEQTVVVGGACQQAPGAPGTLIATPPGPSVTLTWSPPVGGCPATHFVLRAGFAPGQVTFNLPVGTNTSFSGTAAPGTYFVSVVAVNAAGAGPPTNEVTVVIVCAAPGPPVALTSSVAGRVVSLGWAPPVTGGAAAGYQLEAGFSSGATMVSFSLLTTSFSTTAPDGRYFVRVRATNTCGLSPPSNEQIVNVPSCGPPLGAPSTPVAMVSAGVATISWGAVNSAARYRLDVGTTSGASDTFSQFVSGTSQQLAGLAVGNYFMRVVAIDACNSAGAVSGEGSFTIQQAIILVSLTLAGPSVLVVGQSGQFTATGNFSNGTTQNVTATAAWDSSNDAVATPVAPGTINALADGTTTITAMLQNRSASATLQVSQPTATFVVVPNSDTVPPAQFDQCVVSRRAPGQPNHLRCMFDGSGSSPDNAAYQWEIPLGVTNGTSDVIDGTTLSFGCGTLGDDGVADEFDIRLMVTVGTVTVTRTRRITFIKAGAC